LEINKQLKAYCEETGITYIDLVPTFADENGKLSKQFSIDGLHVNGKGYLKWVEVIKKYVDDN
jgi:lysophospholipase L1-like esterase